jgi:hypothetical protein
MPALRKAILVLAALSGVAHADTLSYISQSRSVDAWLELSPSGGPPNQFQSGAATSDSGGFDEVAAVAESGYASTAAQNSLIYASGILANGAVSLSKPLLGSDLTGRQSVVSALTVEFDVLAATPYYLDANFSFETDTGGMITAFGSLTAALSGPGGTVFEQINSFPIPDSLGSVDFSSGGLLSPGTYTFSVYSGITLDSMPYEIGGDGLASYDLDFGVVPEPSAIILMALLAVAGVRRA